MQSTTLKLKAGIGSLFYAEDIPQTGNNLHKRMTLLPCAVVFDELSPAFTQLSSQVLHVLTFQEKQNTLFDTALLRVELSFWRGKRPKFNCIQMRLFFPL